MYSILDDGHISSPAGFRATGVSSGLKEVRTRDLALVYSLKPCQVATCFTNNALQAAPIFFNQAVLSRNRDSIRAVLINAGQANTGTGPQGLADAVECAKLAADELEVPRDSVLLMSSGQIGVPLPMRHMKSGIRRAVSELDSGGGRRAALAIMTSDSKPKERALNVALRPQAHVVVAGIAKGGRPAHSAASAILALITSDIAIEARLLTRSLNQSVEQSFARLALDNVPSPNDSVIALANGASGTDIIADEHSREFAAWQEALDTLCVSLAHQVLRDAAGNGTIVQVVVRGAANQGDASLLARAVARSAAVRWACAHSVADWGGILVAVGASGVELRADLLELRLGPVPVLVDGVATPFDSEAVRPVVSGPEIELTVDLHIGSHGATVWTCTASE